MDKFGNLTMFSIVKTGSSTPLCGEEAGERKYGEGLVGKFRNLTMFSIGNDTGCIPGLDEELAMFCIGMP